MESKTKIIIILIILILILVSYAIYSELQKYNSSIELRVYNSYQKGLNDGSIQIINTINREGKIPVIINENNQTSIEWIGIQDIFNSMS